MTPDVIEKQWRRHDNLAVTVNDASPWLDHMTRRLKKIKNTEMQFFLLASRLNLTIIFLKCNLVSSLHVEILTPSISRQLFERLNE